MREQVIVIRKSHCKFNYNAKFNTKHSVYEIVLTTYFRLDTGILTVFSNDNLLYILIKNCCVLSTSNFIIFNRSKSPHLYQISLMLVLNFKYY
jgi:hypothetical protein